MAHTNLAKSKNAFEHVLAESILLVALGQTIAFCEAKMFFLSKSKSASSKCAFAKAALLDWSAPGLRNKEKMHPCSLKWSDTHRAKLNISLR